MKILYFSTVNWKWIKQRPHFLAYYLSNHGHEVDYFSINPLGKTSVQRLQYGNLQVKDTYVLPYALKSRLIESINISYIGVKLAKECYDLIILTNPLQYQYITQYLNHNTIVIYECMDNMPFFYEGRLRERMLIEEQRTLEYVDAVITSSDKLQEILRSRIPARALNIRTIYNAVDYKVFQQSPKKISLQEPNLLYLGTIGTWLDWETLHNFAEKHPYYTIYLIGPNEKKPDPRPSNIIIRDPVPHSEVLDYIYSGNIMLLPFKVTELTESVDPVKLYEYLSMNKPILSTHWPELDKFQCDHLKFYKNEQEFENYALQFSRMKHPGNLNQSFIEFHNWNNRVMEYINFIEEVRNKKREKKG